MTDRDLFVNAAASLVGAISLLKNSPKSGAPSDKMFDQMVSDYEETLRQIRERLAP